MSIVTPAVLVPSRGALQETLSRLIGLSDIIQIDIVDGIFSAPATWPYTDPDELYKIKKGEAISSLEHFAFEVDLMVERPEASIGTWLALGASRVVIHVESVHDMPLLLRDLKEKYGHEKGFAEHLLSVGIALNVDTPLEAIEPYLSSFDYVQCMGIDHIGVQGQPFDRRVLEKIRTFRRAHPEVPVQVDGGVSLETAPELLAVGVGRLCVGSALLQAPDLALRMEAFERIAERYGRYS